jgi:hypothetical protein
MPNDGPTFEEQYWWYSGKGVYHPSPNVIRKLYAEAHPPKVTAEAVWCEVKTDGLYVNWHLVSGPTRKLCQIIADYRNVEQEKNR